MSSQAQASTTRKRTTATPGDSKRSVADIAKDEIRSVAVVAEDAVGSGAWFYPVQGIFFLLSHPKLLQPLIPLLIQSVLYSLGVLLFMFTFTYLPQVAFLALVSGPLAFVGAIPLVLGENYVVILFLTRVMVLGQAGVDLFDAVLLTKNHSSLIQSSRQISTTTDKSGSKITKLGKGLAAPLTSKFGMLTSTEGMVRYVLSLGLNLIPAVGTVVFLGYNGLKSGPSYHARYFQLKGWDKKKQEEEVSKRRGAYTAFGTVAVLFNLVPLVSSFFQLTSTVGAALWASDLENRSNANLKATDAGKGEGTVVVDRSEL